MIKKKGGFRSLRQTEKSTEADKKSTEAYEKSIETDGEDALGQTEKKRTDLRKWPGIAGMNGRTEKQTCSFKEKNL